MHCAQKYLNELNHDYLAVHRSKEDLYWTTHMGTSNDHNASAKAEKKWLSFISDRSRLEQINALLEDLKAEPASSERDAIMTGLTGWLALFKANVLESDEAIALKDQLIKAESQLFEKRQAYSMRFINEQGEPEEGTTPVMSANIASHTNEQVRQSSHQALLELEQWVLDKGFIEIIKLRNKFAKAIGYESFFDYAVVKNEQMTADELFVILEDFEQRTRDRCMSSLQELADTKGRKALKPYNLKYTYSGDSTALLDPYTSFDQSLKQWVQSFSRLGIEYSGAKLTLDLLNRKGKYANGFCHAPVPAFYDQDTWIPAEVNFTSLAEPGQIGSGYVALETLFHEGGHAAHFANTKMNAPCFSQEFAPSSMAFAETQSMFLDSLIRDGDWLKTYAIDAQGHAIPDDIIQKRIAEKQPFLALEERGILAVPYFERALYSMDDDELTAENITELARDTEMMIMGLPVSPRPLITLPHILSDQSACAYHGYLMADMAVYQTRAYFIERFGYLTDNPEIGPLLAEHYWKPGNSISHDDSIRALTGEGFNAKYLAEECNLSVAEAWERESKSMAEAALRVQPSVKSLNANIAIADGNEILASNDQSDEHMFESFSSYVTLKSQAK
ncbi:M3 family metallopeptidase [Reinekea sp.]|jgi:oligoendopeptidase F|uniref:M3 family metallopeptidase n=1 Tax=Reinekea sp. TaxID=1970455 RepID=UPI003988F8D3